MRNKLLSGENMKLCDKISVENIRCSILLSDKNGSAVVHWNGEDFVCTSESELFARFDNDVNNMHFFLTCLEKGGCNCGSYDMEIMG